MTQGVHQLNHIDYMEAANGIELRWFSGHPAQNSLMGIPARKMQCKQIRALVNVLMA